MRGSGRWKTAMRHVVMDANGQRTVDVQAYRSAVGPWPCPYTSPSPAVSSPAGFVNSIAMNMYSDGTEGLGQHFDDAGRFAQPIVSLRLFSDSRLSFGTHFGWTNSQFFIPMPRGCVTVMHEGGYAANKVKHCIRPADLAGKSAAVILRQIHPHLLQTADALRLHREAHRQAASEDSCRRIHCFTDRDPPLFSAAVCPAKSKPTPTPDPRSSFGPNGRVPRSTKRRRLHLLKLEGVIG